MPMSQALVIELEQEAATTRRMLERVPEDRLGWQPHEKSMSLARLAGHLANLFTWSQVIFEEDGLDLGGDFTPPPVPENRRQILDAFDTNIAACKERIAAADDARLMETWTMRHGERVLARLPRASALRSWVFNHALHHRGQLSVYLRLLDVPLPQVYGPTADDPAGFGG